MPESLRDIGLRYGSGKISGHDYCPTYERILGPLRDQPATLCELGVLHGESIAMWLEYGPKWQVIGVDAGEITPCPDQSRQAELTRALTSSRFTYFQCAVHESQAANLLRPECCDVLIDDASHDPEQVWAAFQSFWQAVKPHGYYVIEDVWSSRYLDLWYGRLQSAFGFGAPREFGWEVVANFKTDDGSFRDDDILLILRKPS